jgi:polysaccharide export outer membrane protein
MLWVVVSLGIAGCASPPSATDPVTTSISMSAASPSAVADQPSAMPATVAGAPMTPAASAPVEAPSDYLIGPQDLLKIDVFGVEGLNRSVRVNSRGQIALPLVGLVQAGGLTGEQLAADIAARLAKDYLQNPQVTIFIEEFTSQRTAVVGAVKTPGVYPLKGRTTLMQVVASAGGTTSVASGTAMVLRPGPDGTRKMLQYDLVAIRDGEAPDPDVLGEDVVHVETSGVKATVKEIMEFILPFRVLSVF